MKESKKLKNLIESDGAKLREKHADFYNNMLDNYYPEKQVEVVEKKSFNVSKVFTKRVLAGFACCLVLVLSVSFGIKWMVNKNNGLIEATNSGSEISIPKNAERVQVLDDAQYNVNELSEVDDTIDLTFGKYIIQLDTNAQIYEDVREQDGYRNFYYVTHSYEVGFYNLQIIFDKDMNRVSRLGENKTQIFISGLELTYSVVYVENTNLVYFFAEAETENEILAICYSTNVKDCEMSFINFLNTIIK